MIWLFATAWADPAADLARQREVVGSAAAAVAAARADGNRGLVAERMATYRTAAAALEALERSALPTAEEERRARWAAQVELTRALAEGTHADDARRVVAEWLGEPTHQFELLTVALAAAGTSRGDLRRGLLLDVVEHAEALVVLLDFDAAEAERSADQLELRALSLRRQGPGQAGSISIEVEAVALAARAAQEQAREESLRALRERAVPLRAAAIAALEGP